MRGSKAQLIDAALADPTHCRALELICSSEAITSQELCEMLGLTAATISHHLRQLRLASLIIDLLSQILRIAWLGSPVFRQHFHQRLTVTYLHRR